MVRWRGSVGTRRFRGERRASTQLRNAARFVGAAACAIFRRVKSPAFLLTFAIGTGWALAEEPLPAKIEFNRDVRPILSDTCFKCHGFDPKHREAGRRFDTREGALAENDGVRAIVPGDLKASEAHLRLRSTDRDEQMPPRKSGKTLTARQKAILDKWIEQGAEYQEHWAYIKPTRPAVPEVRDSGQPVRNPIDAFVQARLAERGLKPSPQADAQTLVRRVNFDLVGLPPKPEEIDALANTGTPDAYEAAVAKLLASPHYGERMAVPWLDIVRFADTIGYHSDNARNVWPYRDYVIRAFNENKRFDQFTIEQLAGDLLPKSTQEQKVGSAFNRLLLSTEEGGAQAKDYESRMLTDRVRAVGTVWLGHTIGCAQCHDHKYDPVTTRDFYAMGAFFADIKEASIGKREDGMLVVPPAQEAQLAKLDGGIVEAKKQLTTVTPQLDAAQQQWEADVRLFEATLPELRKDAKAAEVDKTAARKAQDALKKEPKDRNAKDKDAIRDYFRSKATALFRKEIDGVTVAQRERDAFYNPLPKCLVSVSDKPRTVRILPRGNWMDESGEVVQPALLHFLPQPKFEDGRKLTRLDLAQWLVARDNPLTARVFVNRLWKQFFGVGLSKVLDDVGTQGEPPVNPALLDWLAVEFMDSGWDVKHMVRLIVTSHTYRQVSTASKELLARDPENRELARQSRFRLDAELVRDNALSIAGLLVPKIGGPSVKPYQPAGYWENLNFPAREWQNDTNENQWRRGLYTWWQRSYLQPSMVAFDAPSREESCAERVRSNIPQQALALLNDPTYVEAARAFAARIVKEGGRDTAERIAWAYHQALGRAPRADELQVTMTLFGKHLALYAGDGAAAEQLIKTGQAPQTADVNASELAAWTNVARVILNLHETITRS